MPHRLSEFNRIAAYAIGAAILAVLAWHSSQRSTTSPVGVWTRAAGDRCQGSVVRRSRLLMGTQFNLSIWASTERTPQAAQTLLEALDQVAALEQQISSWKPDSETSAVNRHAGELAVQVSPPLRELVARSLDWTHRTQGAFDVTGGPLFDLWARARRQGVLPTAAEIAEVRQHVGLDRLVLDGERVKLTGQQMKMSFGAIGKGFAADRAAAFMRQRGFENFIIDAGGDTVISGRRGDDPWEIAIRHPRHDGFLAVLPATNCAIATSGDYEQFTIIEGKRYGHIIDPRSGWPVEELTSVTVISRPAVDVSHCGTDADALATALSVMGSQLAMDLVNQLEGFDAIVVDHRGQISLSAGLRLVGDHLEFVR